MSATVNSYNSVFFFFFFFFYIFLFFFFPTLILFSAPSARIMSTVPVKCASRTDQGQLGLGGTLIIAVNILLSRSIKGRKTQSFRETPRDIPSKVLFFCSKRVNALKPSLETTSKTSFYTNHTAMLTLTRLT